MGKIILITSGKGGVGKSTTTCGLGVALCKRGNNVLLIDTDEGLRTLDLMMGVDSETVFDLEDVLSGRCSVANAIKEVVPPDENGKRTLRILPAPANPGVLKPSSGFDALKKSMAELFDYVLIDSPAGLGIGLEAAASGVDEAFIVTLPDPVGVRIASMTGRRLEALGIDNSRLIINRYNLKLLKKRAHMDVDDIIDAAQIRLIGVVPQDGRIPAMTAKGKFIEGCSGAQAYSRIAARLDGKNVPFDLKKLRVK